MIIFLKNFFKYRLFLSRAWLLLLFIGLFLAIVSFAKGIQILMFIPAFVLSVLLYAIFEYFFISKNVNLNINISKNWNLLKFFFKNTSRYNFIIANKNNNWIIEFLVPNNDFSYDLDLSKNYNLYVYIFWKFDIFRKIVHIWSYNFFSDFEKESFDYSSKYVDWEIITKLDSLKTSLHNYPYTKKIEFLNTLSQKKSKLNIESNLELEIKSKENIYILHILLIIVWSLWIILEWMSLFLSFILITSILICYYLRKNKVYLSKTTENFFMLFSFVFMLILSYLNKDMSWSGSIFLIQLLLISLLTKKWEKNSFLFIFLTMFVFVAISLFSSNIWFILLFLSYLFISTYLLFFISWSETFEENNYKLWTKITKIDLFKSFSVLVFLILFLFFLLPHGWSSYKQETWINKPKNEKTVTWFNEEIKLDNISAISNDNKKIFVIEDISQKDYSDLWLKYFRWMRFDYFDWKKWDSKNKNILMPFTQDNSWKNNTTLKFTYFLEWTKNIFIPKKVLKIDDKAENNYSNLSNDQTILKINQNINDNLSVYLTFKNDGKLTEFIENTKLYDFKTDQNVEKLFENFIKNIPNSASSSPENLTKYIKTKAWFKYSITDPAVDLKDFLYWKKAWHCEYFATTLAFLMQYYGYNATLVNWYMWWEYNELANSYIIRWKDAHSWVEVYDEDKQIWKVYDPTPQSFEPEEKSFDYYIKPFTTFYDYINIKWYVYIVNYTSSEQLKLFLYIYSNKFIILKYLGFLILIYFSIKYIKKVFRFLKLNKKEKIMFILSYKKWFKNSNIFHKKYSPYIYWNIWNITYKDLFFDLFKKF